MFQYAALQHLGKLKNPVTDKIEKDLPQAQASIDMIEMLHEKMKGNLTGEEERMISTILRDMKLNYVDELNKPPEPSPDAQPSPETKA
jgi:hypothetical protein